MDRTVGGLTTADPVVRHEEATARHAATLLGHDHDVGHPVVVGHGEPAAAVGVGGLAAGGGPGPAPVAARGRRPHR